MSVCKMLTSKRDVEKEGIKVQEVKLLAQTTYLEQCLEKLIRNVPSSGLGCLVFLGVQNCSDG